MSISVLKPIITTLVEDGAFGKVNYLDLKTDDTAMCAQFSSNLTFVNLVVNAPTGEEVLPLLVKFSVTDPETRGSRNLDAMFHNEVTMYKEILPALAVTTNLYPRLFYGLATNGQPEKDLIILENLKYKNYLPSKTKVFLDIDHISVAIRKIAEFHSFSFIHKHDNKESFLQMISKLKSIDSPPEAMNEFEQMSVACLKRGIEPLLRDNVSVDLLNEFLNLLKYPIKTRDLVSFPEEPFAVICHGDFCNNNLLYKFDENGNAVDCVFVDFQLSMYGSPAIDIFFFLYMSTTLEQREKYWDEILMLYWDTLRKSVPNNINIPSFEEFLKHFAGRVIYGYIIASFFLPLMMQKYPVTENENQPSEIEEKTAWISSIGGKEAEKKISEIVLHLLNKGYIHAFIELCKNKNF